MAKVKEIRKIESNIKEIKKEKKEENLEEEFEDGEFFDEGDFISGFRRSGRTSTLEASEIPQTVEGRQNEISKEDRDEINFRPSYIGGGNPYQNNNYTPVGSSESSAASQTRSLGERNFDQDRTFKENNSEGMSQSRGEVNPGKSYVGERDQGKERKRNM